MRNVDGVTLVASFLLAATANPSLVGPAPREFAKAIAVNVRDIRRLSCKGFGQDEPTEAVCNWQQRVGKSWKRRSTYVAIGGSGWVPIDDPAAKP